MFGKKKGQKNVTDSKTPDPDQPANVGEDPMLAPPQTKPPKTDQRARPCENLRL